MLKVKVAEYLQQEKTLKANLIGQDYIQLLALDMVITLQEILSHYVSVNFNTKKMVKP